MCNFDCKLDWLSISPTWEPRAVKARRVFAALQSKSFQIVLLTQEATRLLLLRLANCFLISNYQNIMRTKIPCVQWISGSSLTCQRQCFTHPHLITPLTSIALVIVRRRQFDSQVDFMWHICQCFSMKIINCRPLRS